MFATGTGREKVEQWLESFRANPPKPVSAVRWEFGNDWTGDPGVFIYIALPDKVTGAPDFTKVTQELRRQLSSAIAAEDREIFPFIRFRSVSEERRNRRSRPRLS